MKAVFLTSATVVSAMPEEKFPEYAFAGRSNVGKSSLINALTGNKSLAHTSSTPGKTQTINHFLVENSWYLADLPGYGFAKVSKKMRGGFSTMIHKYLLERKNLECVMVLVDSRIPPQESDLDFTMFLGENQIPFAIVFTKTDKSKGGSVSKNIADFKNTLLKTFEELPPVFQTSAVTGKGINDLQNYIGEINSKVIS